jgi:endonuclease YncB( thermonuclease family)
MLRVLSILFSALLFAACATVAPAIAEREAIAGQVIGVSDGDTLTLLTPENRQVKVRLAEIDAPESGQPYGAKAKQELSELVFGKPIRAERVDTDRYGRTVARVYSGDVDVNAELLRRGAAWAYRDYLTDATLLPIEEEARQAARGLWMLQEDQRIAPWDWRRSSKGAPSAGSSAPAAADNAVCGAKRYCKQMANCAEARHYLLNCGLTRLDGDGDGVPCEALCR